jgi:hypothetical protein|tara:strand:+ start:1312 stop:2169 length:858 start_codon:yes stop_codon:yes gene_type:complete
MPKKVLNTEIINKYLEHIQNEKKVSDQTIKTYKNIGNNIPFNLLTLQPTIIKKLKDLYDNPNTLQLYLNMIILVRKYNNEEVDKLIKFRNSLSDSIKQTRKDNLDKMDDKLPSLEYIQNQLNELTGIRYIINYIMINHGLRNKDLNLKFVKVLPKDKEENYIMTKGKNVILNINDYKTDKTHGTKEIKINNSKFLKELKSLNLKDGDYILPMKNGDKINNLITFNDKILKLTIDRLGQNRLVKIVVKDLLNDKNFSKLDTISKDRGTSLEVLLKSYNLHNGNDKN